MSNRQRRDIDLDVVEVTNVSCAHAFTAPDLQVFRPLVVGAIVCVLPIPDPVGTSQVVQQQDGFASPGQDQLRLRLQSLPVRLGVLNRNILDF